MNETAYHFFGLDRCECEHIRIAHADRGNGACEGVYTTLDGEEPGPCQCRHFRLKGLEQFLASVGKRAAL